MDTVAGRYDIIRQLGRGSFGHTWLAVDRETGREVAIKHFDPRVATDLKARELFEREAAVLRALRHQGVPEIYDSLQIEEGAGSAAILVMEYIDGKSIEQLIDEKRPRDLEEVLALLFGLLGVLDYLHSRVPPILHRDIKPANIIVRTDGTPVLVDFGSVRRVFLREDESGSTIVGTYGYMPYEQYMGQATPSSDLYALAATMLHLVTGRAPREFMGERGAIDVPAAIPGETRLGAVLRRMLRAVPAERHQSAREVQQALLGAAVAAAPPALPEALSTTLPARESRRAMVATTTLEPVLPVELPRQITGEVAAVLRATSPSMLSLMNSSRRPDEKAGLADWMMAMLVGTITFGVLPIIYLGAARSHRYRMKRFLRHGIEGTAEIRGIQFETTSAGERTSKVSYDFVADGELRRDADNVHPMIAQRWAPGDVIRILYIPEQDYQSVIISTR